MNSKDDIHLSLPIKTKSSRFILSKLDSFFLNSCMYEEIIFIHRSFILMDISVRLLKSKQHIT